MISHTSVNKEAPRSSRYSGQDEAVSRGRSTQKLTFEERSHSRNFKIEFQNRLFSNLFFFNSERAIFFSFKKQNRDSATIELTLQEIQVQCRIILYKFRWHFLANPKKAIITHLMPAKDFEALKYKKGRAKLGVRFAPQPRPLLPRARFIFCLQRTSPKKT